MATERVRQARRIQSIDVGFRVIRVLAGSAGKLPLKTIAARAGMPPSKAYLYLASFSDLGLVAQDVGSGHYGLGPYAVELGLAGMRQLSVVDVARRRLPDLQSSTGRSVYLSIWGNMGPVILTKFDSDLQAPVGIRVGSVLPLQRSATGRVFLSFLPDHEVRRVQAQHPDPDADARTDEIRTIVRRQGFATSDSEFYEGFAAIAAPVFDYTEAIAGSVTLLGLRRDMNLSEPSANITDLLAIAAAISEELGFPRTARRRTNGRDHGASA